jgi:hypothetical protein
VAPKLPTCPAAGSLWVMGLLDEAIREHLELKRRRGADPTEVERLEREALGPVRRIQTEPEAGQGPEMADEAGNYLLEDADRGPLAGADYDRAEVGADDEFDDRPELEYATENEHSATQEPGPTDVPPDLAPDPAAHGVVPPPEPAPAAEEAVEPPPSDRPVFQDPGVETAEYDVEAEHAKPPDGEDVLEETPEFLQDAPEHDRLWFEQRPPKDFDFDG